MLKQQCNEKREGPAQQEEELALIPAELQTQVWHILPPSLAQGADLGWLPYPSLPEYNLVPVMADTLFSFPN